MKFIHFDDIINLVSNMSIYSEKKKILFTYQILPLNFTLFKFTVKFYWITRKEKCP